MKITITDRFIYNYIDSYTKNDKAFFASNKWLAEKLNRSISVISHSISRLIKLGLLENKGTKFHRELYTKGDIINAENSIINADFDIINAENSITLAEIKQLIAKNSTNKMLKTASESAENSNILIKLLISYTNKLENSSSKVNNDSLLQEFEVVFWKDYPRKISKPTAKKAFLSARKKDSLENIMKGLSCYKTHLAENKTDEKYIAYGASWLNGERWNDQYDNIKSINISTGTDITQLTQEEKDARYGL